MSKPRNRTTATAFQEICRGDVGAVLLAPPAYAEYRVVLAGTDKLSLQRRVHLSRYFEEFCSQRPPRLGPEKFKKEGDFPDGFGGKVAVWEFKAWQWRLYGSILTVEGRYCFVGMRVDPSKKQNKANPTILRATASDIAQLVEYKA